MVIKNQKDGAHDTPADDSFWCLDPNESTTSPWLHYVFWTAASVLRPSPSDRGRAAI